MSPQFFMITSTSSLLWFQNNEQSILDTNDGYTSRLYNFMQGLNFLTKNEPKAQF